MIVQIMSFEVHRSSASLTFQSKAELGALGNDT